MRILLLRPKPSRETIGLQSVMICEPLELMTLAAVLRKNGHTVTIIDMILERRPLEYFIKLYTPETVGITGYISHIGVMEEYAARIKKAAPGVKVCAGGVHAAVRPEDFSDIFDAVCKTAEDFYRFTNCADTSAERADRNLPERYLKKYYYLFQNRCALIKTSFGCPYSCNFCFCKEIEPYSARPLDDVIQELKEIKQTEVYIVDDDFLFNRERLLDFAGRLRAEGIYKRFLAYGRADFIARNEDVIRELAETGLSAVIVGLESANQTELDSYEKRSAVEDNAAAVRILQKYNIELYATVILGADWEKPDFDRLYKFLKDLGVVFVNLQPFTPMPGTPYFESFSGRIIIPYNEHEKWDMAHLVIEPKIPKRKYYKELLTLYFKITLAPRSSLYVITRYGFWKTFKLSLGAAKITLQYLKKIISKK